MRERGHRRPGNLGALGAIEIFRDSDGGIDSPCGIIASGNDVWFTSIANGRIGRVRTADGTVETFADPQDRMRLPANLFPSSDGRLWVTCLGSDSLASFDPLAPDPSRTISISTHPDLRGPVAIKAAATGLLWFTVRGSHAIASLDPRASDPSASFAWVRSRLISDPSALFVDCRGMIWWVNAGTGTVGRLDPAAPGPAAVVERFGPWPDYGAPRAWAMDSAGTLWLTTQDAPGLLTIDAPAHGMRAPGEAAVHWCTDESLRTPDGVWVAADGAVWIADTAADAIVRYEPATRRWAGFTAPGVEGPFDIKPGPDESALWFTNKRGSSIGRINVSDS